MDTWDRINAKTHQAENGCVEWCGATRDGYGLIWYQGKLQSVHRLVWMLTFGSIPEGQQVLHKCDNRICVRIDHLFLGTQADNLNDAVAKNHLNRADCGRKRSLTAQRNIYGQFI